MNSKVNRLNGDDDEANRYHEAWTPTWRTRKNAIVSTNDANGQITQATGFSAAFGSTTVHSRTLNPNEKVYVTQILVKHDAVQIELLTVDVATLGDGVSTRYRAESNKVSRHRYDDPQGCRESHRTCDRRSRDRFTVESKMIKIGIRTDQVKKSLGNPDKIVDLGTKQVYLFKDLKVVFLNSEVSDVQ